jgi:hypothetical protein
MAFAALSERIDGKPDPLAGRVDADVARAPSPPSVNPAGEAAGWFASNWRTPVTASDLREVVRLLRKHPEGLPALESHDVFRKRLLDPHKLAAYREWRVIAAGDSLIRLTPFGQSLADALAPEARHFRALLGQCPPYRQTLDWLLVRQIPRATENEVIDYWRAQWSLAGQTAEAKMELKTRAVSFFHLCQAADFGVVTLGKRGQPTRLRVDQDELRQYLTWGAAAPAPAAMEGPPLCVAISASRAQTALAGHIQTALGLADIQSELLIRDGDASTAPHWRACNAGLLIVSGAEQNAGRLAESVWLSLGAASALYADRLLLLWEKPSPPPDSLARWRRCEFNGAGLTWQLGAQIVEAVKAFRSLHD